MRALLPLLLFAATISFALGVTLPLLTVERLFVFTDRPSLAGMVAALATSGDTLLAAVIGLFSIALPALKLYLLHRTAYLAASPDTHLPRWVQAVSKWSMLDVVLVAIVIFAAKTSGLATAFTSPGLWFFAASVALTAIASSLVAREPDSH